MDCGISCPKALEKPVSNDDDNDDITMIKIASL
jgi:hypothetical protein